MTDPISLHVEASFHVVPSKQGRLPDQLATVFHEVMVALLDVENSDDDPGVYVDSAAVSLDLERSTIVLELQAYGPTYESAEHRGWQAMTMAIAQTGGIVVEPAGHLPDDDDAPLLFEQWGKSSRPLEAEPDGTPSQLVQVSPVVATNDHR